MSSPSKTFLAVWSQSLKWLHENSKWLLKYVPQTTFYERNTFFSRQIFIFMEKLAVYMLKSVITEEESF